MRLGWFVFSRSIFGGGVRPVEPQIFEWDLSVTLGLVPQTRASCNWVASCSCHQLVLKRKLFFLVVWCLFVLRTPVGWFANVFAVEIVVVEVDVV